MASPIEKFLTERGVMAPEPNRPVETYSQFWARTTRWLAAAEKADLLVRNHGAEAAREILNGLALEMPAYFIDERLIPQLGREGTYGFVLLPGGCRWALEKDRGGQCAFCEFQEVVDAVAGDLPFSHEEFVALFHAGFATMDDADMMNVFTAGSFLNPGEIPMGTQKAIAEAVAASKTTILRVESRVQYMVDETIGPLVDILNPTGKTLDIAIGFETQDDDLRNKILRKGMSRGGFVRAVETAKRLGARVSAYVMLMPLAMDEGYAIRECVDSIRFCFDTGADEVLLQARYSHYPDVACPKLWSVVQVLRDTASMGPVMLGRWEGELPPPVVWPKNCDVCTPQFMNLIETWRHDLDPTPLADERLPSCTCKADWETEAAKTDPPKRRPSLPLSQG